LVVILIVLVIVIGSWRKKEARKLGRNEGGYDDEYEIEMQGHGG